MDWSAKYLPWLTERVKNRFKSMLKWIWALSVWTLCVFMMYVAFSLTVIKADTIVITENDGTTTTTTTTETTVKTNNTDPMKSTTPNLLDNNGFQTGNTNDWTVTGDVNVCSTCGPFGGKALRTAGEDSGQTQSNNGTGITGGTTMTAYGCTSGTDETPLGWSGTTMPGTTKILTGSVSSTHTITTSGTVGSAMVARDISVSGLKWVVAGGHSVRYFFTGGTASQDIACMVGGGIWDSTNHFIPVGMGSAAPAAVTLGDIKAASHGAAASDTMTVQMTVKKISGYNTPKYEGNGKLGFGQSAISGKGY